MEHNGRSWGKEKQQLSNQSGRNCDDFFFICRSLRKALDQSAIFRPELAILLELYDAELQGEVLNVSSVGLRFGVPMATMLRHLQEMEENGMVLRSEHQTDRRVILVRIAPSQFMKLDKVFNPA